LKGENDSEFDEGFLEKFLSAFYHTLFSSQMLKVLYSYELNTGWTIPSGNFAEILKISIPH
jgi:hypothetical protein